MARNVFPTPAVERYGLRRSDPREAAAVTAVLRAAGGLLLGAFLGLLLTLALVVARAHVLRLFVHSVHDLVGPLGLPALVFPLVGAGVGVLRPAMLRRAAIGSPAGLCVGAALGAALGAAFGAHGTHVWAGGIVGGGIGAALAAVFAAWRDIRRGPGGGTDTPSRGSPEVMGRQLQLNATVVFLGVFFWGWLWGIPGALLAVPLLATFKISCDHVAFLSPVGTFLAR